MVAMVVMEATVKMLTVNLSGEFLSVMEQVPAAMVATALMVETTVMIMEDTEETTEIRKKK